MSTTVAYAQCRSWVDGNSHGFFGFGLFLEFLISEEEQYRLAASSGEPQGARGALGTVADSVIKVGQAGKVVFQNVLRPF